MTAVGCATVEVNPPQRSIKQREKCGLDSRDIHIHQVRREKSHPEKLSRRAAKQCSGRAWGCERQEFRNRRQRMSDVEG
jgi:hypothetical protein